MPLLPRPTPARVQKAMGADDAATERRVSEAVQQALERLAGSDMMAKAARQEFARAGSSAFADVLALSGFSQDMLEALRDPIAGVYLAKAYGAMSDLDGLSAALNFETLEPRAIQFATAQAGKRVVAVSNDIRRNVSMIAALGQNGELTAAQQMQRIRQFIPMLPSHAEAAQRRYTAQLERGLAAGLKREDAEREAEATLAAATERYKRVRADMIARTETLTASNTGRFEGWAADIAEGVYSRESRKEWVAGTKACDVCDPSTGEVVMWDKPFENGAMMPPLHPNCRCTAVLLPPDTALRGPTSPTAPGAKGQQAQRVAQQRAEGKEPGGTSAPKANVPHKRTASNPDRKTADSITNRQGQDIAVSAQRAQRGEVTQAEHRELTRSITGAEGRKAAAPAALPTIPKNYHEADWRDFPKTRGLAKEQKDAVEFYVSDRGYKELNGYLRGKRKTLPDDAQQHLGQLQQALATQTTKRDMMVKRGQNTLTEFGKFSKPEDLVGRTATSDGFLSTTGYSSGGRYMPEAKPFREAKVRMEVYVPKGTHATAANNDSETELIIAPGSRLTVVGARKENGVTHLQVVVTQD